MKKSNLILIIFLIISYTSFAQEEFLENHNGISISRSSNIDKYVNNYGKYDIVGGGLSLYLKYGLFVSGSVIRLNNDYSLEGDVGIMTANSTTKGFWVLSYGSLYMSHPYIGSSLGLIKMYFPKSNFPLSITGSTFLSKVQDRSINFGFAINYSQALFVKYRVYPIIGISKSFNLFSSDTNDLYYHLGLNVKL